MDENQPQTLESKENIINTSLLLARVERHKDRLKSDPRPIFQQADDHIIDLFQACVQEQGLTKERGKQWQSISHANVYQLYAIYDTLSSDSNSYQTVIEKDIQSVIQDDLHQVNQEALARVLKAYSVYDAQVGYCHGMAPLVVPLLSEMEEKEAFATFVRLMELYDLRRLFISGLSECLSTYQSLLATLCPDVKRHLDLLRIYPSMYAASWFPSLFTNSPLPITQMKRLYDLVFLEGAVETTLRFSLCLMQRNEKMILSMNQADQVLAFIQSSEFFACYPHDAALFYQDMMQLNSAVQHQITQTADLARTVAQLQKENTQLKMQGMEQEAAQLKLSKRNAVLEKRVKKYKVKLAHAAQTQLPPASVPVDLDDQEKKKKDNFNSFVESLRDTGDFGALIAGAIMTDTRLPSLLTVNNNNHSSSDEEDEDEHARKHQEQVDAALQNVTSELVAIKIDHFETTQRYEALYRHCEHLSRQLQHALEHQTTMMQKIIYLTSELEDTTSERDQLYQDQEQVLEMATVAKKTAAELQLEKMTLTKEVELLEQRVAELEKEKQQFFMPRDTFSEEVFAAHSILFGQQEQQKITQKEQRRHTMAIASLSQQENEYKTKYVESELRCRELEKYLAEAKVRLAELETSLLYPVRRASSVHLKRSSTASILARVSTPTTEPRASTESYASSTTSLTSMNSSQYNSKRSSMYSRIWNAFGNSPITPPPMTATTVPPTTTTVMKNSIICQEPQII